MVDGTALIIAHVALAWASGCALLSALLVWAVRRHAIRREIVDHPEARRLHTTPTPRGGGAGVVAIWLITVLVGAAVGGVELGWPLGLALCGVVVVALVGWRDDQGNLDVRTRILAHAAAGLLVVPLGLIPTPVPGGPMVLVGGWWAFCAVASVNVINFVDGIDGLIGLTALLFGVFVAAMGATDPTTAVSGLALAGASAGFLFWNWSPARIFLGDVGSGALGYILVITGILLMRLQGWGVITCFLPLWPVVLDATATLWRRWRRGERLTEPHRDHLYQRLAANGWGHSRVALLYGVFVTLGIVCASRPASARIPLVPGYLLLTILAGALLDRRATGERSSMYPLRG